MYSQEINAIDLLVPRSACVKVLLHSLITRKMVPITGRASLFLEFLKLQPQSKLNPNQTQSIFCSSFFLCLQGQSELCGSYYLLQSCFSFFVHLHGQLEPFGSYHLLQSCFSFFICLHGQTEPFGSCIILQSCSSFFFHLHCQPEVFVSDHLSSLSFLSNSISSPRFNLLRVVRCCFSCIVEMNNAGVTGQF